MLGWLNAAMPSMMALGAVAIVGLAVMATFSIDVPVLRWLCMIGIAVAGTVAMIVQARRRCAQCGTPFGFRLTLRKTGACRRCGSEFPVWPSD